jgi:hypothetical protein
MLTGMDYAQFTMQVFQTKQDILCYLLTYHHRELLLWEQLPNGKDITAKRFT